MSVTISIVAPIFNELENIPELYRRVKDVMSSTQGTWELILVDDGSSDGSTEAIRTLAQQDKHVRPVIFARNFGHQVAITAGWDYAPRRGSRYHGCRPARPARGYPRNDRQMARRLRSGLCGQGGA